MSVISFPGIVSFVVCSSLVVKLSKRFSQSSWIKKSTLFLKQKTKFSSTWYCFHLSGKVNFICVPFYIFENLNNTLMIELYLSISMIDGRKENHFPKGIDFVSVQWGGKNIRWPHPVSMTIKSCLSSNKLLLLVKDYGLSVLSLYLQCYWHHLCIDFEQSNLIQLSNSRNLVLGTDIKT